MATVVIATAVSMLYITYRHLYPTFSWNQKLTVQLNTPNGEFTGSSVSHITWRKGFNLSTDWNHTFEAEALHIELPDDKHLFALITLPLNQEYIGTLLPASLANKEGRVLDDQLFRFVATELAPGKPVRVPSYQWPRLVTFEDLRNKDSVHLIESNDITKVLGKGYSIKSVTIELTGDQPSTNSLRKVLTWLRPEPEPALLSRLAPTDFSAEANLRHGDFLRKPR
ncbi:hypothetical protein HT585_08615 [Ensifer sp. HO-A22]|uniref:Uncharacterized protein n=1 Tax=Ensifer oleiphilus TaxID=2742698 RepID=A0A7Y6Q4K4_9HYPH|nr:hypothetical protein [Ensifer oleiphilus]NVD38915.1 hypothetical protein [Ensifer oleiphilus]